LGKRYSIKIARKFARMVRKEIPDAKVILFGSRARGDNLRDSDYDFIIVSDYFEGIHFDKRMPIIYRMWDFEYD